MRISDWSSDVCSSDLAKPGGAGRAVGAQQGRRLRPGDHHAAEQHQLRQRAGELRKIFRQPASVEVERLQRTPARSEEHTSELQSLMRISYAVFCLKKKKQNQLTKYQHLCTRAQTIQ